MTEAQERLHALRAQIEALPEHSRHRVTQHANQLRGFLAHRGTEAVWAYALVGAELDAEEFPWA